MSAPKNQREEILRHAESLPSPWKEAMIAGCTGRRFSSVKAGLALVQIAKANSIPAVTPTRGRKQNPRCNDAAGYRGKHAASYLKDPTS